MRGRNKSWDAVWDESHLNRRDFRDDHGSGPEEMPHVKPGRKKGRGTERADHKHIYETNGWEKQYHSKWSPVHGFYIADKTRWYLIRKYECLECGKKGKTEYDWKRDPASGHYYMNGS